MRLRPSAPNGQTSISPMWSKLDSVAPEVAVANAWLGGCRRD
jgi:hypothetical protein